jgi:hypothetical protein
MTATITKEIKTYFITNTVGYNLVALLINMPSLGNTNSPTNDQLLNRENLTMATAVAQEISSIGYKRHIVILNSANIVYSNGAASISITANFTPASTQTFGPFTHVVFARGANLIGANSGNGNNRGDTTGTVYKVEPVTSAPQSITNPTQLNITTTISITI